MLSVYMFTRQAGFDLLVIFIFVVVEKRRVGFRVWRAEKAGRWRVAMVTVSLTDSVQVIWEME